MLVCCAPTLVAPRCRMLLPRRFCCGAGVLLC